MNLNDMFNHKDLQEIDRRGFLKGLGAAAVAGAAGSALGKETLPAGLDDQDLGDGFIATSVDVAGFTVRAVLDTTTNTYLTPNRRPETGGAIIRNMAPFIMIRDGKVDMVMRVGPKTQDAMKKAGLLQDVKESTPEGVPDVDDQGVEEGSDISGLLAASHLNKSFIITAETAEGQTKKFRVKAQNERVAKEKFSKHHSMAKIVSVKEEGVAETSDYFRRREREEAIISGQKPARKKQPAQTSDYARRREQEKKAEKGVAEGNRFDEPLTGYHIVYRNSGNPVSNTPSFETKDQAQKYLMTKMFANHQDFKVVHTANIGMAEMDKSAPQPGRDGKVSHKTYGSRDNYKLGDPETTAKLISAEKVKKDALDILKKQGMAKGSMDEANIQPSSAASRTHIGNLSDPVTNSVVHPGSGKEIGIITKQPGKEEYYAHPTSTALAQAQGATFATKDQAHQFLRNAHAQAVKNGTLSKKWLASPPLPQFAKGQGVTEGRCPECGGPAYKSLFMSEEKDACYHKVRSRYKVWPSAYASGALVQCRKKGAANWGNKGK